MKYLTLTEIKQAIDCSQILYVKSNGKWVELSIEGALRHYNKRMLYTHNGMYNRLEPMALKDCSTLWGRIKVFCSEMIGSDKWDK